MGVVYRARDMERGVDVALKTLRGITPESVLRFKTEFRALRDLRHPNLVELGELFENDGTWFFFLKRRLGEALGGSEGATLISQADALCVRSGWLDPERGAELALPTGRFTQ